MDSIEKRKAAFAIASGGSLKRDIDRKSPTFHTPFHLLARSPRTPLIFSPKFKHKLPEFKSYYNVVGAKILQKSSTVLVGRTNVTDRRQTTELWVNGGACKLDIKK